MRRLPEVCRPRAHSRERQHSRRCGLLERERLVSAARPRRLACLRRPARRPSPAPSGPTPRERAAAEAYADRHRRAGLRAARRAPRRRRSLLVPGAQDAAARRPCSKAHQALFGAFDKRAMAVTRVWRTDERADGRVDDVRRAGARVDGRRPRRIEPVDLQGHDAPLHEGRRHAQRHPRLLRRRRGEGAARRRTPKELAGLVPPPMPAGRARRSSIRRTRPRRRRT